MRPLILLLICLTIGCGFTPYLKSVVKTPIFVERAQHAIAHNWKFTQSECEYSDESVALYTSIFIELWEKEDFPQGTTQILDKINIIEIDWQKEVFTYANPNDGKTRLLGLTYFTGLKKDKVVIFVTTHYDGVALSIEQTAYGHELIHVALGAATGNTEVYHFSDEKATIWPPKYEAFLNKVAKEYSRRTE